MPSTVFLIFKFSGLFNLEGSYMVRKSNLVVSLIVTCFG